MTGLLDLRAAPLALYLNQIAEHRRRHHPLVNVDSFAGTPRRLSESQTEEQRERQTELLLAARRRAA